MQGGPFGEGLLAGNFERGIRGGYRTGLWKEIRKEWETLSHTSYNRVLD